MTRRRLLAWLATALCCLVAFLLISVYYAPPRAVTGLALGPLPKADAAARAKAPIPADKPTDAVNVNAAGPEELCRLTGIGPALAERIIREREQNGPFAYVEDLLCVKGIGKKTLQRMLKQLSVD